MTSGEQLTVFHRCGNQVPALPLLNTVEIFQGKWEIMFLVQICIFVTNMTALACDVLVIEHKALQRRSHCQLNNTCVNFMQ